jgi:hypothetical protein
MANSGFKQATIAYKVSDPEGLPLDINGEFTSVSLRKQAIFLLEGYSNPAPTLYEVEGYFTAGGSIMGEPTEIYDPANCPNGIIWVSPINLVLTVGGPSAIVSLFSDDNWTLISAMPAFATLVPAAGPAGFSEVVVSSTATEGQGLLIFKNDISGNTASVYVVNVVDPSVWILDTGTWDNLGFWFNTGIWNF